jgi:hypothetical protein
MICTLLLAMLVIGHALPTEPANHAVAAMDLDVDALPTEPANHTVAAMERNVATDVSCDGACQAFVLPQEYLATWQTSKSCIIRKLRDPPATPEYFFMIDRECAERVFGFVPTGGGGASGQCTPGNNPPGGRCIATQVHRSGGLGWDASRAQGMPIDITYRGFIYFYNMQGGWVDDGMVAGRSAPQRGGNSAVWAAGDLVHNCGSTSYQDSACPGYGPVPGGADRVHA